MKSEIGAKLGSIPQGISSLSPPSQLITANLRSPSSLSTIYPKLGRVAQISHKAKLQNTEIRCNCKYVILKKGPLKAIIPWISFFLIHVAWPIFPSEAVWSFRATTFQLARKQVNFSIWLSVRTWRRFIAPWKRRKSKRPLLSIMYALLFRFVCFSSCWESEKKARTQFFPCLGLVLRWFKKTLNSPAGRIERAMKECLKVFLSLASNGSTIIYATFRSGRWSLEWYQQRVANATVRGWHFVGSDPRWVNCLRIV